MRAAPCLRSGFPSHSLFLRPVKHDPGRLGSTVRQALPNVSAAMLKIKPVALCLPRDHAWPADPQPVWRPSSTALAIYSSTRSSRSALVQTQLLLLVFSAASESNVGILSLSKLHNSGMLSRMPPPGTTKCSRITSMRHVQKLQMPSTTRGRSWREGLLLHPVKGAQPLRMRMLH